MSISLVTSANATLNTCKSVLESTDATRKLYIWAVSYLNLHNHIFERSLTPILKGHLITVFDMTSILAVFQRAKGWIGGGHYTEDDGSRSSIADISTMVFLTGSDVITFLVRMENAGLMQLGRYLNPLNKANDVLLLALCVCNIWSITEKWKKQIADVETAESEAKKWKSIREEVKSLNTIHKVAQDQIKLLENNVKYAEEALELKRFTAIRDCQDLSVILAYCQKMADWKQAALNNAYTTVRKSVVDLALDVTGVALAILSITATGPLSAILALVFALRGLDFMDCFLGDHVKQKLTPVEFAIA